MKKFENDSTAVLERFGRDRRVRTVTASAERVERRPRPQRDAADSEEEMSYAPRPRRASYNPHFTADNRPVGAERPHRPYGDRRQGGRSDYGERRREDDRAFRSRDERPAYGECRDSAAGDGEHRPWSGRPAGRKPYGSKSAGKPFGRKPFGGKSYGDKPYGGKSAGEKPFGKFRNDRREGDERSGRPGGGRRSFRRDEKPQQNYPRYNPNKQTGEMRLNRFIAQSGICSRREADDFITAGLVSVNGVVVTELGTKVMPTDEVKFNDSRVQGEKKVYLVLNKPKGYVTSLEDPHADKTVMELVKGACTERIYPVGRLDKNSVGLLLFTNDGDLTRQLTHPSYRKKKIYQVSLDKPLTRADMDAIAEGVTLDDGEIYADEVSYVKEDKKEIGIEIHSGRNRIVRRIFEHLGYAVQKLDRVYYAGLTKKNLKRGQWRFLTREEVERLKSGQYE